MTIASLTHENSTRTRLAEAAESVGAVLIECGSLAELTASNPDMAFVEWPLRTSVAPLLDLLQGQPARNLRVVVLVDRGASALSARALAAGATDVLFLPVDQKEIIAEIQSIAEDRELIAPSKRIEFAQLRQEDLVGETPSFRACLVELQQAANSDANILLTGETGTGKEMFARAIHRLSRRASEPYRAINCAALPLNLLESELFGHVKGAFTGADKSRDGRFADVGAGTLLLDEVGDMPPQLQVKLLRVIETRRFERLGENASTEFSGRLLCATSVDLRSAIEEGRFRRDLLGRINQFEITLPSLRSRIGDIPTLALHFLRKHSRGRQIELSATAMNLLTRYSFPMNIRELENAIIGSIARCIPGEVILPKHLPADIVRGTTLQASESEQISVVIRRQATYDATRRVAIRGIDEVLLREVLRQVGGNLSAAAEVAGIDRKTFRQRMGDEEDK